jgi:uncharacterized protein YndB with AHSA1/START domain
VEQVEVRRRIAGPRERVFAVYTDHASWAEWAGVGAARLEREGVPAPNGVGCVRVLGPRFAAMREEVLSFEAPRRMTYRIVGGPPLLRDHFGDVDFAPDGDGTLVVWRCRFESRVPGLGGPLRRMVERTFRGALEGLARHRFPDR